MTMPEKLHRDLMRRSLFNLRYVELARDPAMQDQLLDGFDDELSTATNPTWMRSRDETDFTYEFTQLLNSFLLAFVHPWERYYGKLLSDWTVEDANLAWGLPIIERRRNGRPVQSQNLQHLINFFRNALAHGNLRFSPDRSNQIWLVELWNIPWYNAETEEEPPKSKWTFVSMKPEAMRDFLFAFARMTEDFMLDQAKSARARLMRLEPKIVEKLA